MPQLYPDPFGLAWLGLLIWIVIIVVGGWVLLMLTPFIVSTVMFAVNLAALPFRLLTGRRKEAFSKSMNSGQSTVKEFGKSLKKSFHKR